jgi:predicted RNA-binding Zn ribbon-like protein
MSGSRRYRGGMSSDAVSLLGADTTSHFRGNRLCLALVNSVYWRRGPAPEEHLESYEDLVDLADGAGWLPDRDALLRLASRSQADATRAVARAVDLRAQLLTVFAAHAAGRMPADNALRAIEKLAARGLYELRLVPHDGGYRLGWPQVSLELPVLQAAVSAMLLLADPELARVKQCPGPTCGWVFLDTTRNQSRRWCDSRECGNRSRVHAHYQRTRGA